MIESVPRQTDWNKSKTARQLGLSRTSAVSSAGMASKPRQRYRRYSDGGLFEFGCHPDELSERLAFIFRITCPR